MSYTIKVTGRAAFRTIDLKCPKCEYEEERTIDLREVEDEDGYRKQMIVQCPNCDHPQMEEIWKKAPSVGSNPRSDSSIAKMQKSFKERFVKKELNDVRHKYGRLYDDSVKSAAVQRIKKSVKKGK